MSVEGILRVGTITEYPVSVASRTHCRVSVSFPDNSPRLSNAVQAADVFDVGFETTFTIDSSNTSTYDMLVSDSLRIVLLSVSADTRHQTSAFEFQLYLDPILTHRKTMITADLIGKHCDDGEFDVSITPPSLHVSFELSAPVISQEDSDGSTIMKLKAEEMKNLPRAIPLSTLHQDDQVHTFDYGVAFRFPCGRVVQISGGRYLFGDLPSVKWDTLSRVFLTSSSVKALLNPQAYVDFEVWRDINDDFSSFGITDTASSLVYGRARFPTSEFTKPGQSHYFSEIPIFRSDGDDPIKQIDSSSSTEEHDPKGKNPKRKMSSRNSKRKQKRAITAKDKKQLKVLTQQFSEFTAADGFDGNSLLSVDLQFSNALVLKPLVPRSTLKPSDIRTKKEKNPSHKLEDATKEFRIAVQRIANEVITAQKQRQDFQLTVPDFPDELMPLLHKEPSYHVALEKLRSAISFVFGEYSIYNTVQSEAQMQDLQSKLPFFLHDELCKQMPEFFVQMRRAIPLDEFLIKEAEEAELMGRSQAASELLEELIALDLTNANSWWLYSKLMLKHGNPSRAEECVRRGLTCDPNHVKLSILFTSLLTRQEKYFEAIDFLNSAHLKDRKSDIVISLLNSLANIPTNRPTLNPGESPLEYAEKFMNLMDVVFAEQLIAQEQMKCGETAEVLLSFGRLHYCIRDLSKSVSFLTRAVKIEKTADALLLLGHVEFERGRFEEAAQWYEEGLELQFEQKAALRLGFISLKFKQWLKAESYLFQCSPQSASVLLGLGIAAINLEKYKQADELLNRATVINFRHPEIWAHIALFSKQMKRIDEAEHAASMAIKWQLRDEELLQRLKQEELIIV